MSFTIPNFIVEFDNLDLTKLMILKSRPDELIAEVSKQARLTACRIERPSSLEACEASLFYGIEDVVRALRMEIAKNLSNLSNEKQREVVNLIIEILPTYLSDRDLLGLDGPLRFIAEFIKHAIHSNEQDSKLISHLNKRLLCGLGGRSRERERGDTSVLLKNLCYWLDIFDVRLEYFSRIDSSEILDDVADMIHALKSVLSSSKGLNNNESYLNDRRDRGLLDFILYKVDEPLSLYVAKKDLSPQLTEKFRCAYRALLDLCEKIKIGLADEVAHERLNCNVVQFKFDFAQGGARNLYTGEALKEYLSLVSSRKSFFSSNSSEDSCKNNTDQTLCEKMEEIRKENATLFSEGSVTSADLGLSATVFSSRINGADMYREKSGLFFNNDANREAGNTVVSPYLGVGVASGGLFLLSAVIIAAFYIYSRCSHLYEDRYEAVNQDSAEEGQRKEVEMTHFNLDKKSKGSLRSPAQFYQSGSSRKQLAEAAPCSSLKEVSASHSHHRMSSGK